LWQKRKVLFYMSKNNFTAFSKQNIEKKAMAYTYFIIDGRRPK